MKVCNLHVCKVYMFTCVRCTSTQVDQIKEKVVDDECVTHVEII